MSLGRIKRVGIKRLDIGDRLGYHDVTVRVRVTRVHSGAGNDRGTGYKAFACIGPGTSRKIGTRNYRAQQRGQQRNPTHRGHCSRDVRGRSPQSAIAKALKALSGKIALRGRKM